MLSENKTESLCPGLYLVATPIGNLKDITLRALDVLRAADQILAEDTRRTRKVLTRYDINTPLKSLHDHNQRAVAAVAYLNEERCKRQIFIVPAGKGKSRIHAGMTHMFLKH